LIFIKKITIYIHPVSKRPHCASCHWISC